jgi:hypothetical protein
MGALVDWGAIEIQLRAVAERGEPAWQPLQAVLHPELVRLARFQPIGRLRKDVDAPHEIATGVLARLHANDYRAIKKLFAADAPPAVAAWMRVLVRSAAIDVMRAHPDYLRRSTTQEGGWISLHSLVTNVGAPRDDSLVEKQRDVERFLDRAVAEARASVDQHGDDAVSALAIAWRIEPLHARRLIKKGDLYLPVLRLVVSGRSYPEVAAALELTRRDVELIVSYVEEFLEARRFNVEAAP